MQLKLISHLAADCGLVVCGLGKQTASEIEEKCDHFKHALSLSFSLCVLLPFLSSVFSLSLCSKFVVPSRQM